MSCTVCNHPERRAIDLALLDRTATLAQLSARHQLSQSALHRHKQHLLKKMAETQNRFQDLLKESYLVMLNTFLAMVWGAAQVSQAEGNSRQLLQAVRQGAAIMKFMAKLDGSLTGGTVHRLLASPQWAEADSLLPADPRFLADCRQALAASLSLPCPEEPPSVAPEDVDLMQHDLQALSPEAAQPAAAHRQPQTENYPFKREKGGKKPAKASSADNNLIQYQIDSQCRKNAGKKPPFPSQPPAANQNPGLETRNSKCGTRIETPKWLQALDEGRLDINTLHAIGAGRPIHLDLSIPPIS